MDAGVLLRWTVLLSTCLSSHRFVQGAQRDVIQLCNSDIEAINRTAFDLNFGGVNTIPGTGFNKVQCTCSMLALKETYLDISLNLPEPDYIFEGEGVPGKERPPTDPNQGMPKSNVSCAPFIMLTGEGQSSLAKCSAPRDMAASSITLHIPAGRQIHVTLHNHKQLEINPNLKFTVLKGVLEVQCNSEMDSLVWQGDTCPCERAAHVPVGGGNGDNGFRRSDDASTQQRIIAGVVCAVVFLLIAAAIFGVIWWRNRGVQKDLERDPNNIASENPAFTSSRGSGLDRSGPQPEPQHVGPIYSNIGGPDHKIPMDPDQALNLDLQTPPAKQGKGSTDSGVYSMPADKAMVNNNGRYANAPLGPDQMYNPMLNAKQPSTASLTGQGALHSSMDQLDPSALYAQPNKPSRNPVNPNPAPTRSASHDALNKRHLDGDLQQARSRSHNTSMASMGSQVETDV